MHPKAFVVDSDGGEPLAGPAGGLALIKARTETTAGSFAAVENVIGVGLGPPRHLHAREDEMWFIREGTFRFIADDEILEANEGALVFVPRGTAHCFQNIGDAPARVLVMFTPAGMERFFELHAQLGTGALDPAAYDRIAEACWMKVVGPPLAVSHPR